MGLARPAHLHGVLRHDDDEEPPQRALDGSRHGIADRTDCLRSIGIRWLTARSGGAWPPELVATVRVTSAKPCELDDDVIRLAIEGEWVVINHGSEPFILMRGEPALYYWRVAKDLESLASRDWNSYSYYGSGTVGAIHRISVPRRTSGSWSSGRHRDTLSVFVGHSCSWAR
jgi:hypothetical protein